ncbi:MAG: hypothetical protein RL677_366 [Actinomycetota bacterium]
MNRAIKATWLQPILISGLMLILHQASYFLAYPNKLLREQILFESGHFWLDTALVAIPIAFLYTFFFIVFKEVKLIYDIKDFSITAIGSFLLLGIVETSERALAQVPIHHFSDNLILSFLFTTIILCLLLPLTFFEFLKAVKVYLGIKAIPFVSSSISAFSQLFFFSRLAFLNVRLRAPPF